MVEHDLAKVGVASSNLVSRSIFLLLTFLPLYASTPLTILIKSNYCINDEIHLKASFFGYNDTKETANIVIIPKDRSQFVVPSQHILSAFQDKNVTIVDSSEGVVTFKRHCHLMGKLGAIESAFLQKFSELSPEVVIEGKPIISVKASLPNDFEHYIFDSVSIAENMLRKGNGSFVANFTVGNKRKKIYFYYEMQAKMAVFKAKRNLQSGKILQDDDFERVFIDIDSLPSKAIVGALSPNLIVKNYVKEGQIFSEYFFDTRKDVMKKESIKAFLSEGSLVIELHVTPLDDANIGDIVKVKTEQGKVLNAKILSEKEAMILE